jgi:hypothetical protein
MLTFTAPHGYDAVSHTRPAQPYLATLARGLWEARGWGDVEIERYFEDRVPALSANDRN